MGFGNSRLGKAPGSEEEAKSSKSFLRVDDKYDDFGRSGNDSCKESFESLPLEVVLILALESLRLDMLIVLMGIDIASVTRLMS